MSSLTIPVVSSKTLRHVVVLGFIALLAACQASAPKKTSIQLQAFQAKEFETSKKVAFASTMSVFQDLGYTIGTADLDTGFITAKSPTEQSFVLFVGQSMTDVKATAFVEQIADKRTKIRLNFVSARQTSSGYGMKGQSETPIEDPEVYQQAFKKIQKAIFVRDNVS